MPRLIHARPAARRPRARAAALAGLAALALLSAPASAAAPDIRGFWMTDDGEAAIELAACGNALCGTIGWLKSPLDGGAPARDDNNPDAALRPRPLCGLPVVGDLRARDGAFGGGWIYDPDTGRRYQLSIRTHGPEELEVTGFLGVEALGQTVRWRRAPAGQPRCDPRGG